MQLFDPRNRETTGEMARVYAIFEVLHTIADFLAAGLFVIGSILFFSESAQTAGTWCFLAGSIFFALKPTIRLTREVRLASLRRVDRLAQKAPEAPGDLFSGPQHSR
ncbi:YrhK family protein [Citricoccus sp.]|uniref:YrhK family protein n=1 Tax=Citricoccus sp. TaxID=1978372 RepID=UPI0028BEB2EC|nr:YrhK family protein [Citricoccus sp.]